MLSRLGIFAIGIADVSRPGSCPARRSLELGEGLALRLELFDDRLDHQVAAGEVLEARRQRQPPERGSRSSAVSFPSRPHAPGSARSSRARARKAHRSPPARRSRAGLRGDLGDARAISPTRPLHPANHERDANWKIPRLSCSSGQHDAVSPRFPHHRPLRAGHGRRVPQAVGGCVRRSFPAGPPRSPRHPSSLRRGNAAATGLTANPANLAHAVRRRAIGLDHERCHALVRA